MLSSLYNILSFSWFMSNSSQEDSINENIKSNIIQYDEIKNKINEKIKIFRSENKIIDGEYNLSKVSLNKFLNSINKILFLYKKESNLKNILDFIENETEITYHGTQKHLVNEILNNGWNSDNCIQRKRLTHGNGDYFSNRIDSCHNLGGYNSSVILSMIIKPNFSGKYNEIIKYFIDTPYCEKWNFIIDNTLTENYSLGLFVVS